MSWRVPDGMRGRPDVVRVTASMLDRATPCRDFSAARARPHVWPARYEERRHPPLETFPLGVVMAAVDAVEFRGAAPERAVEDALAAARTPLHPGAAAWIRHATHAYLEAAADLAAELATENVDLRPERHGRVVQHAAEGGQVRALAAWGRWYATTDGRVREVRRLRQSAPYGNPDDPSTLAMAYVAAYGNQALEDLFRSGPPVAVRFGEAGASRVRVVEVGLGTGTVAVLQDTSPTRVRDAYRAAAQAKVVDLLGGGGRAPWEECAGCKLRSGCAALPRTPGLLGLDGRGTHRRVWSVTSARWYRTCPAQYHLRDLRLPRDADDSPGARRGRLVHQWLALAHTRPAAGPCRETDLPDPAETDLGSAGSLMTREEYREVRKFLLQHVKTCPLADPGALAEVAVEPRVAAYDTIADVIALAAPDLTRTVDGVPVWRETKTSAAPHVLDPGDALARYPQVALAVCLLAAGVAGEERSGIAELELLNPMTAEVLRYDAADAATVKAARAVLTDLAHDWHEDAEFGARPGPWCGRCPVSRWCDQRATVDGSTMTVDGVTVELSTGEILHDPGHLSAKAQELVASIADAGADPGDEPPF